MEYGFFDGDEIGTTLEELLRDDKVEDASKLSAITTLGKICNLASNSNKICNSPQNQKLITPFPNCSLLAYLCGYARQRIHRNLRS